VNQMALSDAQLALSNDQLALSAQICEPNGA